MFQASLQASRSSLAYDRRTPNLPMVFSLCVQIFPFCKDTCHIGLGLTLLTSSQPDYHYKDLISKSGPFLRCWSFGHTCFREYNSTLYTHTTTKSFQFLYFAIFNTVHYILCSFLFSKISGKNSNWSILDQVLVSSRGAEGSRSVINPSLLRCPTLNQLVTTREGGLSKTVTVLVEPMQLSGPQLMLGTNQPQIIVTYNNKGFILSHSPCLKWVVGVV